MVNRKFTMKMIIKIKSMDENIQSNVTKITRIDSVISLVFEMIVQIFGKVSIES